MSRNIPAPRFLPLATLLDRGPSMALLRPFSSLRFVRELESLHSLGADYVEALNDSNPCESSKCDRFALERRMEVCLARLRRMLELEGNVDFEEESTMRHWRQAVCNYFDVPFPHLDALWQVAVAIVNKDRVELSPVGPLDLTHGVRRLLATIQAAVEQLHSE